MICEQCGTGIPAGPGFCPECGSAVKAPGPEATFKFACPHCRQRIRVPRSWSGFHGHCPACRCSLVIPIPVGRPVLRAVPADESGEPDAVLRPFPPKNMPQALPGYMCSERSARVSPGMLIVLITAAVGFVLAVGLLLFLLFR